MKRISTRQSPTCYKPHRRCPISELYFIVANGIRNTAMPAFGKNHSPGDIWRTVLWVRHLAKLTPRERLDIAREMQREREQHEDVQERGDEKVD